ncbi:NmrA family NAD(P)-binding protein [Pseudorhodoferax sp.]|uniref:NmrA family NAD(P)-binding protein n=1 Tax=Pseudorhodoferax sp. TaxID=1993553 RepID=UPI002DD629F9|nr:NmrA family NAD(P)-binding protein [Pseudorhodoferax sp.]
MHIIMGGTGHVGSAVTSALLARGEQVAIVTRDAGSAARWHGRGASILEADASNPASLRAAFRRGRRAFLLNPPADTSTDTDMVERHTVASILEALQGSGLEKVVAASTAGAQAGERIGDLNVLWELEQGLQQQPIPAAIQRGAYYMSNWDAQLDAARETGQLQAMFPADLAIPMVAPRDLGGFAAERMLSSPDDVALRIVEGPRRYSANDVAHVLSQLLGREVGVQVTPRHGLRKAFEALSFSREAAESYARMTALSIDAGFAMAADANKGPTTLEEHLRVAMSSRASQ